MGILKPTQFLHGVQLKLDRLVHYSDVDCKVELVNLLKKWPLFGASFFKVQVSF